MGTISIYSLFVLRVHNIDLYNYSNFNRKQTIVIINFQVF